MKNCEGVVNMNSRYMLINKSSNPLFSYFKIIDWRPLAGAIILAFGLTCILKSEAKFVLNQCKLNFYSRTLITKKVKAVFNYIFIFTTTSGLSLELDTTNSILVSKNQPMSECYQYKDVIN